LASPKQKGSTKAFLQVRFLHRYQLYSGNTNHCCGNQATACLHLDNNYNTISVIGTNFGYFGKIMIWIIIGIVVFICVFLLVARVHVAKGKKHKEAIGVSDVETNNGADSDE